MSAYSLLRTLNRLSFLWGLFGHFRCRIFRGNRPRFSVPRRLCVALSEGGFSNVRHFNPLRVRRGLSLVVVMPVPPLVRQGLRVALGRIFPFLLASERGHVEVAPGAPHGFVAAVVDEISAEH